MKRQVQTSNILEEGEHTGLITEVQERETVQGFNYIDVFIQVKECKIKTSFSDYISPTSKLGIVLERFGTRLEPDTEVDLEESLTGQECKFSVVKKLNKNDGKTYSNIINDTLRPAK